MQIEGKFLETLVNKLRNLNHLEGKNITEWAATVGTTHFRVKNVAGSYMLCNLKMIFCSPIVSDSTISSCSYGICQIFQSKITQLASYAVRNCCVEQLCYHYMLASCLWVAKTLGICMAVSGRALNCDCYIELLHYHIRF